MRKIKFINPKSVDILIIDGEGNRHIKPCIPEMASSSILRVRGVIPLIASFRFIYRVLAHSFKLKRIKDAALFSLIDILQPKILITFIDASYLMGKIHAEFPEKLTISVQNGFRTGPNYSNRTSSCYSKYPVSLFYGFGAHGKNIMDSMGVKNREYVSAGSLVYDLYKKRSSKETIEKYDVCFIGQHNFSKNNPHMKMLNEHLDSILLNLIKICKELSLSLAIQMRYEPNTPDYLLELNRVNAIDTKSFAKIIPNNFADFEGYKSSTQSNIIVTVHSTLGFEMLGIGKKVLFGASIDDYALARFWGALENFNKLPSINLLESFSENSMRSKLNDLIDMDSNDYMKQTESARKYYMNGLDKKGAQELIKARMGEFLSSA